MEKIQNEKPKVYFVRVQEETYLKIVKLAELEQRSVNNMTNVLLKKSLAD